MRTTPRRLSLENTIFSASFAYVLSIQHQASEEKGGEGIAGRLGRGMLVVVGQTPGIWGFVSPPQLVAGGGGGGGYLRLGRDVTVQTPNRALCAPRRAR